MIAKHSSLCPLCGVYIAKGRSRIERLPEPIRVQSHLWPMQLRDDFSDPARPWEYSPAADDRLREWVHERCYEDGLALYRESRPVRRATVPPSRPAAALPEFDALRERLREYNATDEARRLNQQAAA